MNELQDLLVSIMINNVWTFSYTRVRNDKSDDDSSIASSSHELHISRNSSPRSLESSLGEKLNVDNNGKMMDHMAVNSQHKRQCSSGSFVLSEVNDPLTKGERYLIYFIARFLLNEAVSL